MVDVHSTNSDIDKKEITYQGKKSGDDSEFTNVWLDNNYFEVTPPKPIIVLDPGHGYKGGNVGAQSRKYKFKVKGVDGKVKLDKDKKKVTEIRDVMSLPQYVIDNPKKWIIGDNSSSNHKLDHKRTEFELTYLIADKMKTLLNGKGYSNIIMTRTSKAVTSVSGNKLAHRIDIANKASADYFISIHADGANNFSSGAHAIHSNTDSIPESKKIAEDIMKYYNVVHVEADSPKKDSRGLRVLRTTNKAKRKTLVELGFLTSPKDAKAMFSNVDLMAEQLVKGLEYNIENSFK